MNKKLNLGFRAHDFGIFNTSDELAKTASSFRKNCCIHLAPYKALRDVPKPLDYRWAECSKRVFDYHEIKVAVLGCYINPMHPDSDTAERNLKSFENCLEVSPQLGYPVVATETGSVDERNIRCENTWTDSNFSIFLKRTERLLQCAEKNNVTMAYEAVADKNTIDTSQRMLKVMETFNSPHLRVLFDAVNIFPIHGTDNIHSFFDESVDMLSPYICAMHIKDFEWVESSPEYPNSFGHIKNGTLPVGTGLMPWSDLFSIYRKYKVDNVPMTLENFKVSTLKESLDFCDKAYSQFEPDSSLFSC